MANKLKRLSGQGHIQEAARPHLRLRACCLAQIEARYADRIPNEKTTFALSELPTRRFKSSAQVLHSLKA